MKRLVMCLVVTWAWSIPVLAQDSRLDARVTIDYRDTPAADVIRMLARGAGLPVLIGPGTLRPVTITLTNVRLSNALNAICDNALCMWAFGYRLQVDPLPSERSASLPPRLSFEIHQATAADIFRALAAAIHVAVTIDPSLEDARLWSLTLKDTSPANVLNLVCNDLAPCEWDFDPARGLRVTRKR